MRRYRPRVSLTGVAAAEKAEAPRSDARSVDELRGKALDDVAAVARWCVKSAGLSMRLDPAGAVFTINGWAFCPD